MAIRALELFTNVEAKKEEPLRFEDMQSIEIVVSRASNSAISTSIH